MKLIFLICLLVFSSLLFAYEPFELLFVLDKNLTGYDNYGYCVSHAGDFDMDGYFDIIVGEPYNNRGSVDIYFGNTQMDLKADYTITGQYREGLLGKTVSLAGDVNSDGFSDIIICAYDTSESGIYFTGKAVLYFGNIAYWVDTYTPKLTFSDGKPGSGFGNCVKNAGDFNNDGYDDFIISAYCDDKNGTHAGRAYLYFGGPSIGTIPEIIFTGEAEFNNFGTSVAFAGDVNNDGYSDIIIGAPGYEIDGETVNVGRVYIYYGNNTLDSNPDVVITGSGIPGIGHSIASAGDVNNDGFDDIIVGAPYFGSAVGPSSYAYIYYGGTDMDNNPDVIIEKTQLNFGNCASCAGDINNDDFDDIMISDENNIYFFLGGPEMDTVADYILHVSDNFIGIQSVSLAGDINKDGYKDILVNAIEYTQNSRIGMVYIYSGNITSTGIQSDPAVSDKFALHQNYPNPFNPTTTINFDLPKSTDISLTIYNTRGELVKTLYKGIKEAGNHSLVWDGKNEAGIPVTSGIYLYSIQSDEFSMVKKLTFIK